MTPSPDRRAFLHTSAALGLGNLAFLNNLPVVSAADARPGLVRLEPDIEPLVRLLEDTPREKLLEELGSRVKKGLAYRDVLTALFLAGVRNVQPRPHVGFKFHAVLVVNSAHQASLAGPDRERWLPIFWAVDNFKSAQAKNQQEGGWRMKPVDEARVPQPHKANDAFASAMDSWDVEAADPAAAALARYTPVDEAFALFAQYGCRDFRDIGHKAIYVANAFRTLQVIGRQHAEPVYRSLAYALLAHEGGNPAKGDDPADKPFRRNSRSVGLFDRNWDAGKPDPKASAELLGVLRTASEEDASTEVLKLLGEKVSSRSLWDGLFLAGGELLMRQPGIVALHSLTTLNALRYAFNENRHTSAHQLLQAASFIPLFREAMTSHGKLADVRIDALKVPDEAKDVGVEAVFAKLSTDKLAAARMAMGVMRQSPSGERALIDAGRLLVFLKGTDSHDYKFSTAVMEDAAGIAPEWRQQFLAASLFWLKGSAGPDAPVVARTRAALA